MNFIWKSALIFSFIYSIPPIISNIGEAAVDAAKIMISLAKNSHSVHPENIEKTGWTQHITEKLPKRKTAVLNVDDLAAKRHKPNMAVLSHDLGNIATRSVVHESKIIKTRPYKQFTKDEKKFIQNELKAGVSVKDIGLKLDRKPKSIYGFISYENKKKGVVLPVVEKKHFSENEKEIVMNQIAAGKSFSEIANDLGRSIGSIKKVIFRQSRKQGVSAGHAQFSEKEKEIIFKRYAEGITFVEIGKELKRTTASIRSFLREIRKNTASSVETQV
jgi:DNA-binding CsgD family transcriptional regulator